MTERTRKPRVLCVDDEPNVLEGLELHLRRGYLVRVASSAIEGLQLLEAEGPFAVVLSDMRMPEMNGAAFLSQVRARWPSTTRMLLTGQTDLPSAIQAVNEGQIFRFLTKPCPPGQLKSAFADAIELYNLKHAERELLERTLRGSIKALTDVLALVNPTAFGRAGRVRETVAQLCEALGIEQRWHIEIASMVLQLGTITVDASVAEKLYYGRPLSDEDAAQAARMPAAISELLGEIPRLEPVLSVVAEYFQSVTSGTRPPGIEAQLLRVATDFDVLESTGMGPQEAIDTMRGRGTLYDPHTVDVLVSQIGAAEGGQIVREVPLSGLVCGMVLAEDLRMHSGVLLAPRGYVVNESFVARATGFGQAGVKEPIRVILPTTQEPAEELAAQGVLA